MISFPPRRLADGAKISDLPAAEATAASARLAGNAPSGASPLAQPSPGAVYIMPEGPQAPPRTPVSEKEMWSVELGGAEPYELPSKKQEAPKKKK
eukprot:CAMPEP_0198204812 /NCGR_PEP_ID=MMETSP1445-20131203/8273_1 /TAXON_ID=36898 /ORGANISM="Pyramimonas sp., Strain CCMP2087" /LENGTH=94 /DNA_ID=CAMNT_0043876865 /DNA_START=23 /DNA_END=307 /DNA_ORIENTATION=-